MTVQNEELTSQVINEAIGRSIAGADPDWVKAATEAVIYVAKDTPIFTADDVRDVLLTYPGEQNTTGALGGVMVRLKRAGLISPTIDKVRSKVPVSHGKWLVVWKSNLCE